MNTESITIMLSDNTGLQATDGTAYVAGWINAAPSASFQFQFLGSGGAFVAAPSVLPIAVLAIQAWQSTGIDVNPSATPVTIAYVGGGWSADPDTNSGQLYDAAGCPDLNVPTDQTQYPIVGVPMGGLIGRIGSTGSPFFIGRGPYLMPSTFPSGELQLCINDDLTGAYGLGLKDNSGSVSVAVFNQGLAFLEVSSVPSIALTTATNGNERLVFAVAPTQPAPLPIYAASPPIATPPPVAPTQAVPAFAVMQYPPPPYGNQPQPSPPGPFDFFEFGYNAAADVSAVNGFGLNLSFSSAGESFGVDPRISRATMASAYTDFIAKEGASAAAYGELLTVGALGSSYTPPTVKGEFFAISDPSDMLIAKQAAGVLGSDSLASYWDATLNAFFAVNSYLSIDLSGDGTNVYTGQCTMQSLNTVSTAAYTLSNGTNTYTFYQPPQGLQSALYVFQQAFSQYQEGGSGGDAGLLQMNIWEALCRGIAVAGVAAQSPPSGFSTTAWNDSAQWYGAGSTCNYYAKFLHCANAQGEDARIAGNGSPIFLGGAAYGFSADENPNGSYSGPNVPSKTQGNVAPGSTVAITLGPW